MIFCIFILILFLEPMVREQLDKNDFRHYYGFFFFFERTILKLLDHSYVQSSFATITRHFDNGIWNEALPYYSWRFYGHESPYELIFSWVTIFKQNSAKVPGKLSFTQ